MTGTRGFRGNTVWMEGDVEGLPRGCKSNAEMKTCCCNASAVVTSAAVAQICRKIWGSGSVRSSHQTVSNYALRR